MRRRNFITLLGGVAAAWPLVGHAQQGDRMRRLGILMAGAESDPHYQADVAVFREGLQKLGWVDGQNIRIEVRWAGFNAETMRRYAKELIAPQPDLILSNDTPTLFPGRTPPPLRAGDNKGEPSPFFPRFLRILWAGASGGVSRAQGETP